MAASLPPSPTSAAWHELWQAEASWELVQYSRKHSFDERVAALRRLLAAISTDQALHGDRAEYPLNGRCCPSLPSLTWSNQPRKNLDAWDLFIEQQMNKMNNKMKRDDPETCLSQAERRAPMEYLEQQQRLQEANNEASAL